MRQVYSHLLSRSWERLAGSGGDPVVELQTNFGGGKTHSMLALYHLFGGRLKVRDVPEVELFVPTSLKKGKATFPVANRVVLVGHRLSPAEVRIKPDGTKINTLWGELAWQLGQASQGKGAEAYALVVEEDRTGISPGSAKIAELFRKYAPALVLIDEWVAYARQIYNKADLPAGSFDANITFVHALTEAAKAVPNALVVASLPASDVEVGGEGGKAALEMIGDVFTRLKAVWKPASATESFEIVRRRLFQPLTDHVERDAVCRAFTEMYQSNRAEFPPETREVGYEERLKSAYPIHPELFDRLYEDWSTIDRFQRTRGVLRLMAAVIHQLWESQDGSLLIMPGTVPLDSTPVRVSLTDHLSEGWGAVVDKDVDGNLSRPMALDRENPNLGRYSACRRVARTVFIDSAPSTASQHVRGLEEVRIKLGCAQPGESIATFGDALRRLSEQLHYLYSDASRYWFDTQITITRQAADRAAQFERKPELVEDEITLRIKEIARHDRGEFAGVHSIPADSSEVPDEQACRLVILGTKYPHRPRTEESKAFTAARDILDRRGNSPRHYRNMLVFLAPDVDRLPELEQAVRSWLAWTSIHDEEEQFNLNAAQKRQVDKQIKNHDETITERLRETFCYLLVPAQEGTGETRWSATRLQGDDLVKRASRKLVSDQQMIVNWSPALLRMELDKWLWKDQPHLSVKQIWEYMTKYLYLSRLRDEQVLIAAIRNGVNTMNWKDYFAYAAAVRDDGGYVGLTTSSIPMITLDGVSVLVKPEAAQKQRDEEAAAEREKVYPPERGTETVTKVGEGPAEVEPQPAVIRRFHGTVELDPARLGRDAGRISDEVITHLTSIVGSKAKITLEIDVEVPSGIPEGKIRIITENCNTLKFKGHGFEE